MASTDIIESFDGEVATVTLNRPQARNALTLEMMKTLEKVMSRLALDSRTRCVVLTGAGGAFCAGGDIGNFQPAKAEDDGRRAKANDQELIAGLRRRMTLCEIIHEMPKPTLAVIPGAAAGAGLSLALACDMRIALDTAKITTAFSRIGVSGDYGGSYFLSKLIGVAKARELYFPVLDRKSVV